MAAFANTLSEVLLSLARSIGPIRYVQIGANDGVFADPVWPFLQRHADLVAKGHAFEPHPEYFQRLVANLAPFPQVSPHRCGIVGPDDPASTRTLWCVAADDIERYDLPRWFQGIASLHLDRNAIGGIGPRQTPELHAQVQRHLTRVEVPVLPLAAALIRFGIDGCDALMVDAEGHDWEILRQWDCDSFDSPKVIVMEHVCLPGPERLKARQWFDTHGYRHETIGQNILALHERFVLPNH